MVCDYCAGSLKDSENGVYSIELLYRNIHYSFCSENCLKDYVLEVIFEPYKETLSKQAEASIKQAIAESQAQELLITI